eukprot:1513172-Prymnesium_polylepis.1
MVRGSPAMPRCASRRASEKESDPDTCVVRAGGGGDGGGVNGGNGGGGGVRQNGYGHVVLRVGVLWTLKWPLSRYSQSNAACRRETTNTT